MTNLKEDYAELFATRQLLGDIIERIRKKELKRDWEQTFKNHLNDEVEYLERKKALENFLGEQVVVIDNPDEFYTIVGKPYEVVTKQYAIEQAKEYAENNNTNECITDKQIEYWVPLLGSEFWYREL